MQLLPITDVTKSVFFSSRLRSDTTIKRKAADDSNPTKKIHLDSENTEFGEDESIEMD